MSSLTSINSIPSHDGVFLRPGTVTSPHGTRLSKRTSVDSGINVDVKSSLLPLTKYLNDSQIIYGGLDVSDGFDPTDPHDDDDFHQYSNLLSPLCKMDFSLCEVGTPSAMKNKHSREDTFIDQGRDRKLSDTLLVDSDSRVLSLAEQIIAAMPEKIKNESDEMMLLDSPVTDALNMDAPGMGSFTDSFMEPLLDSDGSFGHKFTFEFSDHNYRYNEVSTPCSSLSPDSSGPLQSPSSISIPNDPPSPTPTTQDFSEFLQASNFASKPFETDFSKLTLTDREQRELYEAARCIQKAYRSYKGRKYEEEQKKERSAAIVIQNCYRRYKQYAYYRQMTHAAVVIQNGYRSYCEHKRFKNTHNEDEPIEPSNSDTDLDLKNFQKHCQYDQQSSNPKELSPSGPLKRTYSQRTQNQAARKIQQFMRQSKVKLQKERDERGKLLHLQLVDCPQSAPFPELPNRPQSDNTNSENQEPLTSL